MDSKPDAEKSVRKKSSSGEVTLKPFTKLKEVADLSDKFSAPPTARTLSKEEGSSNETDVDLSKVKKLPNLITGAGKKTVSNFITKYPDKSRLNVIRKQNLDAAHPSEDKGDLEMEPEVVLSEFPHEVRMAIASLWAMAVGHLFGKDKWHREWAIDSVKQICKHLELESAAQKTLLIHKDYYSDFEANELIGVSFKLKETLISNDLVATVPKDLVALQVKDGCYDARGRVTIKLVSTLLSLPWQQVDAFEVTLVKRIENLQSKDAASSESTAATDKKKKVKRAVLVGLATIGGGAALALSAGLAAPLIGAGAVAVLGSSAAGILTGASGLAIITSIFGAAGAGLTGYKMSRRIGEIEQFEFDALDNQKHLHLTLAISGWLTTEDDSGFSIPWWAVNNSSEQYCLKWEGRYLRELGSAITSFIRKEVVSTAVKEGLKRTVLSAFLKSIAWPLALINAAYIIDNPWNVCTSRAKEAGNHLADVLYERYQGARPITLLGFSLGARVIFFCLQKLATKKGSEGIVEDVVLLGAPVAAKVSDWDAIRKVVSGKVINCYSRMDWMLKFVYRTASAAVGDIAGLGPININQPRFYNYDITDEIGGHSDYSNPRKIWNVLKMVDFPHRDIENLLQILEKEDQDEDEDVKSPVPDKSAP